MIDDLGGISGSREPDPSCTGSGPPGFDPGRDNDCPYELTDERAIDRAMAWHEGYRAALRWMTETTR